MSAAARHMEGQTTSAETAMIIAAPEREEDSVI